MFNLFKSEKAIIAEIHNAFDTAEDRLLNEAKNILNGDDISIEASLARELGFINIPVVKKGEQLIKTREQAELISYYKQTYPFQKFLTQKELDKICDKYKLIYAPISNYIETVPKKNLIEISNAPKLKEKDFVGSCVITKLDYDGSLNIGNAKARELGLPFILEDIRITRWHEADDYLRKNYDSVVDKKYIVNSCEVKVIDRSGLFIAAPLTHFNLRGLKKAGKHGFLKIQITKVKDPIVFRYCRGGIQVLSKWGLEASDELVVNEINN